MPIFRPSNSALWDWDFMVDRSRPSRLFDQNFGLALDDDQIFSTGSPASGVTASPYSLYHPHYVSSHNYRPRRLHSRQESGVSQVDCNKEKFEVKLDVQQFTAEEITVKTVNNTVVIEGKHEEKQDEHGFVSRNFVRKYILPEDVKPEAVLCNLSSDGVLSISAPRIVPEEEKEAVKVIPIIQTGRPAVVVQRQCSNTGCGGAATTTTGCGVGGGPCGGGSTTTSGGPTPGNNTVGNTTHINIQREVGSDK